MPEVYATQLDVTPVKGVEPNPAFLNALRQWVGTRWPTARPWLSLTEPAGVRAEDGSIFRWEPYVDGDVALLEFTWRHPHVDDPSIVWSTQAAFYSASAGFRVSLRVSNSGPEPGEGKALFTTRPRLTTVLTEHFAVRTDGFACNLAGRPVDEQAFPSFVRYELFDPARRHPLILLTPHPDGRYELPPAQIARDFLTLGEVVFATTPQSTFALTRELGRRELSCFHGALRVYLPGLRRDADPYRHPLLTPRHLADQGNRLRLAQFLAARKATAFRVDTRFHELRDERALKAEERRVQLLDALQTSRAAGADVVTWRELAESYAKENRDLKERYAALEDRLEEAEQKVSGLRFALSERRRAEGQPSDQEPEILPISVLEAVEYAQRLFPDTVRILPTALESAADSPYTRPEEVWRALRAIETLATRLAQGPLGRNLKDAFQEHGCDYSSSLAPSTPKRLREQYRFRDGTDEFVCEEHLRLGGSSYDPAMCLRIYFTSDPHGEARIIIGHVGRHLDVISTS